MKKILTALILSFGILAAAPAVSDAAWMTTNYSMPYEVVGLAPLVNAGPDVNITQPTSGASGITGAASDPDGILVSSIWSYTSGPTSASVNQGGTMEAPTLTVTGLSSLGIYTFTLTACDNDNICASDEMQVIVNPPAATANLISSYLSPSSGDEGSITLNGRVTNNGSLDTGATFTSYFEVQGSGTLTWTSPGINLAAGASADVSASRTFTQGSYQVRICADGANTVSEADEGDNCSPWTGLDVTVPVPPLDPPTANISVSPSSIAPGNSATVSWSCSANSTSCVGTNFNTGGANSGDTTVSPGATTTYTVTATNADGSDDDSATLTVSSGVPTSACSDGVDNDGDGKTDFGEDRGCTSPTDDDETDPKPIFIEF